MIGGADHAHLHLGVTFHHQVDRYCMVCAHGVHGFRPNIIVVRRHLRRLGLGSSLCVRRDGRLRHLVRFSHVYPISVFPERYLLHPPFTTRGRLRLHPFVVLHDASGVKLFTYCGYVMQLARRTSHHCITTIANALLLSVQ